MDDFMIENFRASPDCLTRSLFSWSLSARESEIKTT